MARVSEADRVKSAQAAVNSANRAYQSWEDEFDPDLLENYYYGKQWLNNDGPQDQRKYVINLFYPSINTRKPSLLFFRPKVTIAARPGRNDDPRTDIDARARLQQDTVNTFIGDPSIAFNLETGLAVLDAQFRFGVVEVGYTADFVDNPNAGQPLMDESMSPIEDVKQPAKYIGSEGLYVKWIPGKTFRVLGAQHNRLDQCDAVAYYEWHYVEDLKKNPRYRNTANLTPTGRMKSEVKDSDSVLGPDTPSGMVKVWKRWNCRKEKDGLRRRQVWVEGADKFLLDEPFKIWPFSALKFDEVLKAGRQWYPLPPTFNWVSPQNELNETREMQRIHRKRFKRQFQALVGSIEDAEVQKWEEGDDGTLIRTNRENAITPIMDAPLDPTVVRNIPETKADFREITGISGEERGIADAETATQANIIAMNSRVRESFGRVQVAEWLSSIADTMLRMLREHMALPFWIKMNVDPGSPMADVETLRVGYIWKEITSDDLGDLHYDISVAVESMSPVAEESERNAWMGMLTTIANPVYQPLLASSEVLLRKTVGYFGIKSEKEITEIQKAMGMSMMMAAQAALQSASAKSGGQPGLAAPGPTPTNEEIQSQVERQLPQPQQGL